MNIDERIEALTMNLELVSRDIDQLRATAERDGENIRALARMIVHGLTHVLTFDEAGFPPAWGRGCAS